MSSKEKTDKELRAWLEEEMFELIEKLKAHYRIKNTTELLRFIIGKEYRQVFENSALENLIDLLKTVFKS